MAGTTGRVFVLRLNWTLVSDPASRLVGAGGGSYSRGQSRPSSGQVRRASGLHRAEAARRSVRLSRRTSEMRGFALVAAVAALALPMAARAQDAAGDAAKGKQVFAKCQACHSVEAGTNKLGPSLHGVVGRTSGTL